MDYTTEELIKIYEEFRLSHTATASDAQLKHWGNSDEEILQIKIDGARAILRNNEGGMLIQRFIDRMREGNKQIETASNCTMHGVRQALTTFNEWASKDSCWFLPATDEMIDDFLGGGL